MQNGEKQNPLNRQLETSPIEQALDNFGDLQFFPKPGKDECWANSPSGDDGRFSSAMCREHHDRLGELRPRLQQGIELSTFSEPVEPPERGNNQLLASSLPPAILDDLKVHTIAGLLLTEKHGGLPAELAYATMKLKFPILLSRYNLSAWHQDLSPDTPRRYLCSRKQRTCVKKINANCRKGV